jgi:hypothetical protein
VNGVAAFFSGPAAHQHQDAAVLTGSASTECPGVFKKTRLCSLVGK